jgi:spore germination protein YaaH
MNKRLYLAMMTLLILAFVVPSSVLAAAAPADKTTKYRVYQNDGILMEFSDKNKAIEYAKQWTNSYVEQIGTREWLWHNFPRYKVYQLDYSNSDWEFASLSDAIAEARKWGHSTVRDMQGSGWEFHNYPKFRLYQGSITLDSWAFADLNAATAEGKKWANAHVIDLSTNQWVWDNYTAAGKKERREGTPLYQVFQGRYTKETWKFGYLQDAVEEALKWGNSHIITIADDKTIYTNFKSYKVYQNSNLLDEFISLDDAITYAKKWAHASIRYSNREIWNNTPYYLVFQNVNNQDGRIGEFSSITGALSYAMKYANSSIKTYDGKKIWDNFRKLQYWAWNGSSDPNTIKNQTAPTLGLDVDSPTWFQLADADGNITDTSKPETVAMLKNQGIAVHPLVANQFDSALTTAFLANPKGQQKFITTLVNRAAQLGVDGINVDFENLSGKDRDKFTTFIKNLTEAAHAKKLIISIDLPRGSIRWNHQTAFDHEKLAGIVDYIITMTYDHHYSGSPTPGSVAGLQWVEEGVQEFLSYGIPRDKLIMGIPFYVRAWRVDSAGKLVDNRSVFMKSIPALIQEKKAKLTWDSRFNQYKAEYQEDGYTHVFWVENEDTVKARLDIAKKYDLAGVAAWRLGYEQPELWNMMIREK